MEMSSQKGEAALSEASAANVMEMSSQKGEAALSEASAAYALPAEDGKILAPERRVTLTYDLNLELPDTLQRKSKDGKGGVQMVKILTDVRGTVKPGRMLAVMGASGAGKTSLLNCMAMRVQPANVNGGAAGGVTVNGAACTTGQLASISGFVHQDDLFIATLTPREHLAFTAALTLPPRGGAAASRGSDVEQRAALVQSILDRFGLGGCSDILIGGGFANIKGISGGERKRLSTATEFLSRPPVLFLDEPTSGLDSHMAREVVELLAKLAADGHTVVATIHQPSSEIFELFQDLCLLANPGGQGRVGGRTAYFGSRAAAPDFFEAVGHVIPPFYNAGDFYIGVLATAVGDEEQRDEKRVAIRAVCDAFQAKEQQQEEEEATAAAAAAASSKEKSPSHVLATGPSPTEAPAGALASNDKFVASNWVQLRELGRRARLSTMRDPVLTKARLGQSVVLSVIAGSMYIYNDELEYKVQNITGASFFMVLNQGILGMLSVLQVFPLDIPLFTREVGARRYTVLNYVLARQASELPGQIVFPGIFAIIIYLFVGMAPLDRDDGAYRFSMTILAVILTANVSVSMGYAVGALCPTPQIALAVGPTIVLPMALFGGLLLNSATVPPYWVWLDAVSIFKYGYQNVSIFIWQGRNLGSDEGDGDDVLRAFSIKPESWQGNFWILLALFVGWRTLAYFALLWRASKSTGSGM